MGAVTESNDADGDSTPEPDGFRSARFQRSETGGFVGVRTGAATATGQFDDLGLAEVDPVDIPEEDPHAERRRRRRPRAPRVWLQGGTTTLPWGWMLLGWSLVSLGAGVLIATTAGALVGGALGGWIAQIVLWVAMLAPVVYAFSRSVPRGLLRFRWTDLLFGLVLGVALRIASGWLDEAAAGTTAWPALASTDGSLAGVDWLGDVLLPALVAPVVEELFFHAVLLVALYTVFRRLTRSHAIAGVGAALVSTGLFVMLHQLTGSLGATWAAAASVALVGVTGAALVLVTGRLWGAVIAHIVFNASAVLLALVGTLLGVGGGITLA